MYARLWWKDARQFWSIWVFLLVAAAVIQALLLHFLGQSMRHGPLGILAITCASLYAFATGAAAFAGEREMGTLLLLDILPIDRRVVGASKVSFALVTTLGLMLALLAMAAISTDQWNDERNLSAWRGDRCRHDRTGGAGMGTVLVSDSKQRLDRRRGCHLLHWSELGVSLDWA